ncbi:hypothetical protein NM208_g16003 [Fusarium decemcellulare]|uniref:Uncharacterized protein n=1 Tax=Fusarium decemcellulare TaxID=57161 RepID=A0ACC1RET8_9HYPO|nr:hypothetical protein NM208_g16003 [Fusarium decemcellulare]
MLVGRGLYILAAFASRAPTTEIRLKLALTAEKGPGAWLTQASIVSCRIHNARRLAHATGNPNASQFRGPVPPPIVYITHPRICSLSEPTSYHSFLPVSGKMLALAKSPPPALRIWLLVVAATLFLATIFAFYSDALSSSFDYAYAKPTEDCDASFNKPPEVRNCSDPYRRPGYLYTPKNVTINYNKTTYIPYSSDFLDAEPPDHADFPIFGDGIIFNSTPPEPEFLNLKSNPQQWMQIAVAENRRRLESNPQLSNISKPEMFLSMKDDAGLGWLWGRRVVMFSDSVDRFMTQYFCEEFGSVVQFPIEHVSARQAKALCNIPAFNLTLVYFHSAGSGGTSIGGRIKSRSKARMVGRI